MPSVNIPATKWGPGTETKPATVWGAGTETKPATPWGGNFNGEPATLFPNIDTETGLDLTIEDGATVLIQDLPLYNPPVTTSWSEDDGK